MKFGNGMRSHAGWIGVLSILAAAVLFAACTPAYTNKDANVNRTGKPGQAATVQAKQEELHVLFLGDNGHHKPLERLRDIATPMLNRGIKLYYTEDLNDINLENLRRYDALMLYANYEGDMPKAAEEALLTYVAEGGGFVPVHSAAGNFRTSEAFVNLLGAQFHSHGTGVFRTRIAEPNHEVMKGFQGFESWDETYVHHRHNTENRTVLSYRDDEPYTWVRTHGEGRVFYTAWGHDERTWRNPGFHELLERGIRWAAGQDVQQVLASRKIEDPRTYTVLDVPFPPPHSVRLQYEATEGPMDRKSNYPLYYQMQDPLSPEKSIERMIVPAGFRVELFASEPDIVNPIAMNWDERGRLWIVESTAYPYPADFWVDGAGNRDRIIIAEDTDGDYRADKFTEFANGLNIPTAITFHDGGVIVQQAPQTLFLKDTDGDDVADVREVLFEGWSQYDTHAGPSNIHYGLDNWIWGVLGYSGFKGTVGGEQHEFRMGVYRFKQDGSKLEFLRRTNNNTWGLGFNEQGGPFISTANGNPSTYQPFPKRLYDLLPDMPDPVTESISATARMIPLDNEFRQVDWVGAYTAGSGHGIYTARAYPKEYWNRIGFVAEPTGHLVGEFKLEEKGSSYQASHPRNLIASDDQWFSPVVAEVGPDGNVWIADWYNYVIQHNAESDRQKPTPGNAYANPLRDRKHGRIYRIVYEGAPEPDVKTLAGASPEKLVETLRDDNMLWRKHAQRLLVERGKTDVVPALIKLVEDRSVDEIGLNVGAIHALWTLHGLGQLDGQNAEALAAAKSALKHPSAGVRQNAVQVLPKEQVAQAILDAGLLQDAHAQVRLAALVALAEAPASNEAGRGIFALLQQQENMQDQWIREAATLAASVHHEGFLSAADAAGALASARPQESENLLTNASFEQVEGDKPVGWSSRTYAGNAEFTLAKGEGRNGGNALKITSTTGADASWFSNSVPLKKGTRYVAGGWIRTKNFQRGTGRGAQFNVNGPPAESARTSAVENASDWTYVEKTFSMPENVDGSLDLLFGGWGSSTGEVWFDDVVLKEIGPDPSTTLAGVVSLIREHRSGAAGTGNVAAGEAAQDDADVILEIGVKPDVLQFDKAELRAQAGQKVKVVFNNTDNMEHNLVFILPGSFERVGQMADEMALTAEGRQQNYVPDTPDVLAATPVIEPTGTYELTFTVPDKPGEYMFVCTIPGHWRVMYGKFIVEPATSKASE